MISFWESGTYVSMKSLRLISVFVVEGRAAAVMRAVEARSERTRMGWENFMVREKGWVEYEEGF